MQSYNITEDARKRLEIPQKRSLFQDDELSPSAKIQRDHNYARYKNEEHSPQENTVPDRSALELKLKQKIKHLQQRLRRSKKKSRKYGTDN